MSMISSCSINANSTLRSYTHHGHLYINLKTLSLHEKNSEYGAKEAKLWLSIILIQPATSANHRLATICKFLYV